MVPNNPDLLLVLLSENTDELDDAFSNKPPVTGAAGVLPNKLGLFSDTVLLFAEEEKLNNLDPSFVKALVVVGG